MSYQYTRLILKLILSYILELSTTTNFQAAALQSAPLRSHERQIQND